jgi:helix-turn-helix protein
METVHKTYKEKLRPTPEQEWAMDVVLWRCRTLYNASPCVPISARTAG